MGFLQFLIMLFVVLALAAGASWCVQRFISNAPAWVNKVIWGVAFFIIVVTLLTATGIWDLIQRHDPKIPHV